MKNIAQAFALFVFSLLFTSFSFAGCEYIDENSETLTALSKECREQYLGSEDLNKKAWEIIKRDSSSPLNELDPSKIETNTNYKPSEIMFKTSISILMMVIFSLGLAFSIIKAGVATSNAARAKKDNLTKFFFSALGRSAIRVFLVVMWIPLCMFFIVKGIEVLMLLVHNDHVMTNNRNYKSIENYKPDYQNKAKIKISNELEQYVDYYVCAVDMDKQLVWQEGIEGTKNNLTLKENSDYMNCMQSKSATLHDDKNSFTSSYLQNVKHCALNYASTKVIKCGSATFKDESQQVIKNKFVSLDSKLVAYTKKLNDYYCVNQTSQDPDSMARACFDYDPSTGKVRLNGNKVAMVDSSVSWNQLEDELSSIKNELISSLVEAQSNKFKELKYEPQRAGPLDFLVLIFVENSIIREAKELGNKAIDYTFDYIPQYRTTYLDTAVNVINDIVEGESRTLSPAGERIQDIVKDLTAVPDEQRIKELLYSSSNLISSDLFDSVGVDKAIGGDYNIISASLTSTLSTAYNMFIISTSSYVAKSAFSLYGSGSYGKPNLVYVATENMLGYTASYTFSMTILLVGIAISIIIMVCVSIIGAFSQYFDNTYKIMFMSDIPLMLNPIDDGSATKGLNDIMKRVMCLSYIGLAPSYYYLVFRAANYISYIGFQIIKENIYLMNLSAGFYSGGSSTLFSIFSTIMTMTIVLLVMVITNQKVYKEAINSTTAIFVRKLFGSQDNKTGLFLADLSHFGGSSNNMFSQFSKLPNHIRSKG